MGLWEIIFIGIGLSMDAAAVSISNGLVYRSMPRAKLLAMPLLFGLFQGIMPTLGYFAGGLFAEFISQYSKYLIFLILGFIGGKMIADVVMKKEETSSCPMLTWRLLLVQAVATSIDAFAVGVGFAAVGIHIAFPAVCIALTTFVCSLLAIAVGRRFGAKLEDKAQILGGVILVLIGVKALLG